METSLKNQFLVAMPSLNDPSFEATVTLICEHNADGAMGVVINKPLPLTFGDVLGELQLEAKSDDVAAQTVVSGGPVARDRGFVLHGFDGEFDSTLDLAPDLRLSFALDVVGSMAAQEAPGRALFGLGYAGWEGGQLETEILSNAWLTTPCDSRIVFDLPFEARWRAAAELIGVDLSRIAPNAGHD
ncbi:MAG: YqgE/AlgH family protein [Pseudomonadota bacterium]